MARGKSTRVLKKLVSVRELGKCRKEDSVLKILHMILSGNPPAWREIICLPGNGFPSKPECCPSHVTAGLGTLGKQGTRARTFVCLCVCGGGVRGVQGGPAGRPVPYLRWFVKVSVVQSGHL